VVRLFSNTLIAGWTIADAVLASTDGATSVVIGVEAADGARVVLEKWPKC